MVGIECRPYRNHRLITANSRIKKSVESAAITAPSYRGRPNNWSRVQNRHTVNIIHLEDIANER